MSAWALAHDVDCLGRALRAEKDLATINRPVTLFANHPFAKALLNIVGDLADIAAIHMSRRQFETTKHNSFDALFYNGDHFLSEMVKLIGGGTEVTIGFVAAIALYMDVHAALDGDLDRGIRECAPILREMGASADEFSDWYRSLDDFSRMHVAPYHGVIDIDYYRDTVTQMVPDQMLMGRHGWLLKAPDLPKSLRNIDPSIVEGLKARLFNNDKSKFSKEEEQFKNDVAATQFQSSFIPINILATLPILVGHATWKIMYQAQSNGMTSSNIYFSVLAAAHLHSAAKAQGSCIQDWPDMDIIIEREGKRAMQPRKGDQSVHDAAKQYCLALGMLLARVLRVERPGLPSRTFCQRNAAQFTRASYLRAKDEQRDLTSLGSVLRFQRQYDMRKLHQAVAFFATEGPGLSNRTIAEQWQQTKRLGPDQIMQVLQDIAVEDEKYMQINYLGIHRRSMEILGYATAMQCLSERFGMSTTRAKDKVMYEIVYDILWDAAEFEMQGLAPDTSVLYKSGKAMNHIVRYDGDVGLKRINELSLGRQLPSQAPMTLYGPQAVALRSPPHTNKLDVLHGRIQLAISSLELDGPTHAAEEQMIADHISRFPQWLASTPSVQNTLQMVKLSITRALAKRKISKRIENLGVKPDGSLHVKLSEAEWHAGNGRVAKEMTRHRIEFLRGGVQMLTHEQASLAERGLVKAYAGIEPDGRLVLHLRSVEV